MADLNNKNQHTASVSYLAHPLTSEDAQTMTVESGITILQALHNANYPIKEFDGLMVWVNGKPIEDYESYFVYDGDVINVRPVVHGKNAAAILSAVATIVISIYFPPAGAAMGMGQLATGIATAALVYGATRLIFSAFPPPEPQEVERRESYLLASTRNRRREFESLPLVIGKLRVAPDVASAMFGRFKNNEQTVNQVFHFGLQRTLKLEDWRIGDTPFADFSKPPVIHMPDVQGNLPAQFNDTEVIQGGEVKHSVGPLVVTTQTGSIGIEVDMQAVSYDVGSDGDIKDRNISFTFDVYNVSDNTKVFSETHGITGNKINEVRVTYATGKLPKAQYRVEITKNSEDKNTSNNQRQLVVVAVKSLQEDNTDYVNQLRVGLSLEASSQLTGSIDQVTALAYDSIPVFENNSWNIKPTDNPAWWLLWFARGKRDGQGKLLYGGGLADHQIDIEAIIRFGAWCDRKKLTCGLFLNKNTTVKKALNVIARCGRGEITWGSGKLGVIWDDDQSVPVAVFGPANIRANTFAINYDAEKTADEVIVNFLNKDNDYKPDSVRVAVGNTVSPERPIQFQFEGCLDADMAGREANLIAAAQTEMRRTITWETDIEGIVVRRGDVVLLSHDIVGWSESGRVISGSTRRVFTIDKDVQYSSTGFIGLRSPNGRYETFKVTSIIDGVVTLASEPPADFLMPGETTSPAVDWMWFYDNGGKPGRAVRITDVTPKDRNTLSFKAKDFSEAYYNAENGDYVHKPVITPPKPVGNIIPGVLAWETYRIDGDKRTQVLALSWMPISSANQYTVRIWSSVAGGEQSITTQTSGARFDVLPGIYNYRISSVDVLTSQIYSAVGTITITGSADVAQVKEFRAEGVLGAVILRWTYPDNAINMRFVRIKATYEKGGVSVIENFKEPYPINTLTHSGLDVAQRVDYELVLVDSEGNESQPVTVYAITSDNIDQIIDAVQGQLDESALSQGLKDRIDKIDQNELLINGYIGTNDAALEKIRTDLNTAKSEASQGIADANKEINNVNSTLTGAVNNANNEIDQVKQDLVNAVAQEQENNAQLKKELEALIAVAGVTTYSQPDQPTAGKEGDIWFKEDAQGNVVDVYRFHNGAWELSSNADIEANAAAIINEQTVRASADEALGHRIDALTTKVGSNEAAISQEATARANADSAISQLVNEVKATADGNASAIRTEETTRASADSALSSRIDSITSTVGSNTAAITAESTTRANADEALSQRINRISSKADQNEAAISSESTTRAAADGALSVRIDSVTAKAGANESAIQSEITARTDADSALSSRIDSVTAKAAKNESAIAAESIARADADKALATQTETIKSSVGTLFDNESGVISSDLVYNGNFKIRNSDNRPAGWYPAYLNYDYTTIGYSSIPSNNASLDSTTNPTIGMASTAFAVNPDSQYRLRLKIKAERASSNGSFVRIYELSDDLPLGKYSISGDGVKEVATSSSGIFSIREDKPIGTEWELVDFVYTPNSDARFASITLLNWNGMGVNNALYIEFVSVVEIPARNYIDAQITIVNQTITNKEHSLSQQITQLESEFDGKTAAIQQELTTTVNKVGEVESKYSIKVDNNGYVSGFGLISTENNGVPTSEFAVRADKFFIAAPAGSNYDGGDNKYPFIVQNGKVYMRNAVIQNGAIDSAKIANVIQSSNYVPGVSGWKLPKNGAAEFNSDVVVNAQIQANSIIGDIVSAKSKQGTTVTQNIIDRDTPLFGSVEILTARPFDRTLVIRVGLRVAAKTAEGSSDIHPCSGLVKCTSSQYGQRFSFVQSVYSIRGTHLYYNTLDSIAEVIYNIPANTKGTINIYGRKLVRQGGAGGESYVRVFPIDANPESSSATGTFIAQLFKNGADLA